MARLGHTKPATPSLASAVAFSSGTPTALRDLIFRNREFKEKCMALNNCKIQMPGSLKTSV